MVAAAREGGAACRGHLRERRELSLSRAVHQEREICAIAASVTRDGLPQIDVEEAVQGAPDRGAIGAFGWLKPTLADERLEFAVAQFNGHADELAGASTAGEALTFGGQESLRGA